MNDYICMTEMTTAAAAERLKVSERQVARLAHGGELTISRVVGRALLLDAASVHRWAQRDRHNGRPWTAATAWAALALLSGEPIDWLGAPALSRLRHRLRAADADELTWATRRRATVRRMRGWGRDTGLLQTGVSALRDPAMSALFDLSPVERGNDGYVRARDFADVVTASGLFDDAEGEVTVRVVPDDAGYRVDHSLTAATAVDLAESLDARESAAGRRVLTQLLEAFRAGNGRGGRSQVGHATNSGGAP
jgi:excisionase family DNA binding protein